MLKGEFSSAWKNHNTNKRKSKDYYAKKVNYESSSDNNKYCGFHVDFPPFWESKLEDVKYKSGVTCTYTAPKSELDKKYIVLSKRRTPTASTSSSY